MASSLPVSLHQSLVNCRKPKYWDDINYNDVYAAEKRVFALIDVKPDSKEYKEVEQLFQTSPGYEYIITKVERIQNPFAYGSFLINAVYKNATSSEESVIYPNTNDLVKIHLFIEKNLDKRIITFHEASYLRNCKEYAIIKEEMNVREDSSGAVRFPKYLLYLSKKPAKTVSTELDDLNKLLAMNRI